MRVFTRWDEVSTTDETNQLLSQLALVLTKRISNETLRLELINRLTALDLEFLCTYEPDYGSLSTYDCLTVRQITALWSKRSDIRLAVDRREVAVRKFIESEELCRMTNVAWRERAAGRFSLPRGVESKLFRAQRKISSILGDVPSFSDLKIRFGPGATTQVKKQKAHPRRKLSQELACSEDMIPILQSVLEEVPLWVDFLGHTFREGGDLVTVSSHIHDGKLVFVPKSAKTDRPVVVEPSLNTMFQAGIGDHIAARLRTRGIDIRDQRRNQIAARSGSIDGSLATLDLSSASDTISKELVFDLLPYEWADLLSHLRTSSVSYQGTSYRMEKFSSMGNGFTFPLETLIFYALACSCVKEVDEQIVSVYGDDIIVPTYAYDDLVELLRVTGFVPNTAKSFSCGPFRESCGHDYHRGINIRPCYVKGPLAGYDLFRLHNFLWRQGDHDLASFLADFIGPQIRIYGPDGYGDGHLLGDHQLRPHGRNYGWSGYTFETFTFRSVKELAVLPGDRVFPFYSTYVSGSDRSSDEPVASLKKWAVAEAARSRQSLQHRYIKGHLETTLPGVKSYNRIKIYVLD